ncbi:uncharacterized protein CLUP02_08650 [Colletotrichum lupini]|uniref:Uncharacterized protein n=1 Tax=Colletotrichum lupini TaxID=145971 RepID=A0A9Q8SUQ5_9PEZI|nr:uncharacterized protein CLUP02_08650 [Colletotrichum lupini]UQC83156.1 hypothetical protein CLUP02_08650 [Colletotrichum lupini]
MCARTHKPMGKPPIGQPPATITVGTEYAVKVRREEEERHSAPRNKPIGSSEQDRTRVAVIRSLLCCYPKLSHTLCVSLRSICTLEPLSRESKYPGLQKRNIIDFVGTWKATTKFSFVLHFARPPRSRRRDERGSITITHTSAVTSFFRLKPGQTEFTVQLPPGLVITWCPRRGVLRKTTYMSSLIGSPLPYSSLRSSSHPLNTGTRHSPNSIVPSLAICIATATSVALVAEDYEAPFRRGFFLLATGYMQFRVEESTGRVCSMGQHGTTWVIARPPEKPPPAEPCLPFGDSERAPHGFHGLSWSGVYQSTILAQTPNHFFIFFFAFAFAFAFFFYLPPPPLPIDKKPKS